MTGLDCVVLLLTFAAIWLAAEAIWAWNRRVRLQEIEHHRKERGR